MNDYFQPLLNDTKTGEIRFQLPELSEGVHQIELKAWDVFNNSSTSVIDFLIVKHQAIEVEKFYNFPNPLSHSTVFSIQMNGPTAGTFLQLEIFSVDGKPLKRISEIINQAGLRSIQITWDRKDESGRKVQSGTYFARLLIKTKSGVISSRTHKLVVQ